MIRIEKKAGTQGLTAGETVLSKNKQKIVCAAIRNKKTGLILCGARHFDEVMQQFFVHDDKELGHWADADQGFIDQFGAFLTREEAYVIAESQDQFKGEGAPHTKGFLFSEDLY